MSHDPLETLLRLRRRAVDECLVGLAAGIAAAGGAATVARAAERSIAAEAELAAAQDGEDSLVEAFAAWLPGANQRIAHARAAQDRAEAEVSRCRAELTACRTALETIESLRDQRRDAVEAGRAAAEQRALDDRAGLPAAPD